MIILNLFSCVLFFEPKINMVEEGLAPEIIATLDAVTIVVEKELRQLSLYSEQKLVKIDGKPAQWHVGLGDKRSIQNIMIRLPGKDWTVYAEELSTKQRISLNP